MHILYIAYVDIPSRQPSSIQVMKMCQAMVQSGHEVTLVIPETAHQLEGNLDGLWHYYGVSQAFNVHPISCDTAPKKIRPHYFGWLAARHARGLSIDLVYSKHLPAAAYAARQGIPTVVEIHLVEHGLSSGPYLRMLRRGAGFRHFVVLTKGLKSDLLQTHPSVFRRAKMVIAPDGVDLENFQDLPDPQIARGSLGFTVRTEMVAGYAGGFVLGKGVKLILELAERCPQITFLLVGGDFDALAAIKRNIERLDLRNVILPGYVPNAKVPMYLAACDILLLPNQDVCGRSFDAAYNFAHWTSPMKLFEYMASGRMIIASDLPVLREVLNHGTALLNPPEDLDAWERALLQSAADEQQRHALSSNARLEVERYTWTNRVIRCLDTLH